MSLAPAYDLVDVEAVADQHMSTSFAMGIGDAFHPEELTPFEWASMAVACQLAPRRVATRIKALSTALPHLLAARRDELAGQGVSSTLLARFGERLQRRCTDVARHADEIPKVSRDLL